MESEPLRDFFCEFLGVEKAEEHVARKARDGVYFFFREVFVSAGLPDNVGVYVVNRRFSKKLREQVPSFERL